jgi:hypothetical protein
MPKPFNNDSRLWIAEQFNRQQSIYKPMSQSNKKINSGQFPTEARTSRTTDLSMSQGIRGHGGLENVHSILDFDIAFPG